MLSLSVGKNLALLQAEASACVLELANVPNARWLFLFLVSFNIYSIVLLHGTQRSAYMIRGGLRASFLSKSSEADAGCKP